MNASKEKSNIDLKDILRIKESFTDLNSERRSSELNSDRRYSELNSDRRSIDLVSNRRSSDLLSNRRSSDLVSNRKPSKLRDFFDSNKGQSASKLRDYTSENFKLHSLNSFIRNDITRQNMKKLDHCVLKSENSNKKSKADKKVIKSEQNIKTEEKEGSYKKSYMRVASLDVEKPDNAFTGKLSKETDRPISRQGSSIPIKTDRKSINLLTNSSQPALKNKVDESKVDEHKVDGNKVDGNKVDESKVVSHAKTLYRFGRTYQDQSQVSTSKCLGKSATLDIKIQNLKTITEELNSRLQDTFIKEEDDEWGIVGRNIKNVKKLAVNALDASVEGVKVYLDTLKIIDEVPSDRQYGNLIQLNEIFDRLCACRDNFKKEINRLVLEIKPTLVFLEKLRNSEKTLEIVFQNMKKDLDLLKAWSTDLKLTIPLRENYSRDYEILIRVFEFLYAIVSYEENEIIKEKSETRRILNLKPKSVSDILYKYKNDMFSHDVNQFFIKNDNKVEKYWSEIRNFVAEIEKYSSILLFENKCTIIDFFNEVDKALMEISKDPSSQYREISSRIFLSQIIKVLRDEILLIKVSDVEESEIKVEVEWLLHMALEFYILLE